MGEKALVPGTRLLYVAPLLFSLLAVAYLSGPSASAQSQQNITVDSPSSGGVFNSIGLVTMLTFTHTVGSGTNRLLLVGVSTGQVAAVGVPQTITATYQPSGAPSATALVSLGSQTDGGTTPRSQMELFRYPSEPPTGSGTVTITVAPGANYIVGGATSYSGVNQATPTGPFTSSAGNGSSPPTLSVPSAAGELVLDTVASPSDAGTLSLPLNSGQTERWNGSPFFFNAISVGAGSTKPGAAPTVTMAWQQGTAQPWALGAVSIKPAVASAIKLASFEATNTDGGVLLEWQTGYEVDNLGFNVYREEGGRRRRVNTSLLAGSALVAGTALTAGQRCWLLDGRGSPGARYWLEDVDMDGVSTLHGPVSPPGSGKKRAPAKGARPATPLNQLGTPVEAAESAPARKQQAWPSASAGGVLPAGKTLEKSSLARQRWLAGQPAVKISIREEGWYRVTQSELARAGLSESASARNLQLYVDGRQIPLLVSGSKGQRLGPGDYIEFYGRGLDTPVTDTRVYWLVSGPTPGLRIRAASTATLAQEAVAAVPPPATPDQMRRVSSSAVAESFEMTVERRQRAVYVSAILNGAADNFFGPALTTQPLTLTLNLRQLAPAADASTPQFEVALQGLTKREHNVALRLAGADIGTMNFYGREHAVARFNLPPGLLREGENVLTLVATGGPSDVSFADYVRVTYAHAYRAEDNALRFSVKDGASARVGGFSSRDVRLLDITDPNAAREIAVRAESDGEGFAVTVSPTAADREILAQGQRIYLAFTRGLERAAMSVTPNYPSDWNRNTDRRADLIILTRRDLLGSVKRLAALRESEGLAVAVVDVEDLYDEWSYGTHDAGALREFLASSARWERTPRYVLLFGDGSYDPRDYLGRGNSALLPTRLIDTKYMETASDDWLVDFDGDGLPEMAVGRLPVRTAAEAETVVSKLIAYGRRGGVDHSLLLVNDQRGGDGYDFEVAGRELALELPGGISTQVINRSEGDPETIRARVIAGVNRGPAVVNFYGHGSNSLWTNADLLRVADVQALTNGDSSSSGNGPALFVMMTCLNGYFQDAFRDSLAESLLKAEKGGAVAVWASSGMTEPNEQAVMNREFFRQLYGTRGLPLGDLMRRAKAATRDGDIRQTWTLFGDPSLVLW